ncbi:MAG: 2-oxoacid:acceptor oxidoreductase subunit alpha [Hyphomicrobiales bacterium]|nr:2-oxoacid:acceptor oxidoreductase subunit alpha [Hyphomicrobiales bacterium]
MPLNVSVALTGAGGAGVVTAGQILLEAAAVARLYGIMARSSGPQIRGGESAAFVRLGRHPVNNLGNAFDIHIAFDWLNVERFAAEIPLDTHSVVVYDPSAGNVPEVIHHSGARLIEVPLKDITKEVPGGRVNMVGLGALATLLDLPEGTMAATLEKVLGRKGAEALAASKAAVAAGRAAAKEIGAVRHFPTAGSDDGGDRWSITGNAAAGMGAVRGGVRFVAAYPITPATEVLEWLAPNLEKLGGTLAQAEDELASINMAIGGSFGGVPSLTATSGPGLALMMESIGLAVASEVPVVIVDVQRGGPSTGIPTKSEQSDLNIAVYGLHGDAPHIVTAANSVSDCLFTTQWTVHLAEKLQTAAIVLSDQSLGQTRAIVDRPADAGFTAARKLYDGTEAYRRYALTESGVSPMAVPGQAGGEYVADGLEHKPLGTPSSQTEDHQAQLDKRARKLVLHEFGDHWAEIEGEGEVAVVTWGSSTGPSREAIAMAAADGMKVRLVSLRLLAPVQTRPFAEALDGVSKVLVVEQSHSRQFYHYLRAHFDLPDTVRVFNQPGPLPIRPNQVYFNLREWR